MTRNNDHNQILNQFNNIREEISEFCDLYPDTENLHQFGYKCLLQKLQDIENLIITLKKMPITAQSTPQTVRFHPAATEADAVQDRCNLETSFNREQLNSGNLLLPDDLTPHTKFVLNKIYEKFEKSFDDFNDTARKKYKQGVEDSYRKFERSMSLFREKLKADIRLFIESVLELGIPSTHAPIPHDILQTHDSPSQGGCAIDTPLINFEAVKQTLNCPGVDSQMKQQFLNHLRHLNDDLSEIMAQAKRREKNISQTNDPNQQLDANLDLSADSDNTIFHTIQYPK